MPDIDWLDEGTTNDARVDYPDFAALVAQDVSGKKAQQGILICGSGIGMCIAANKFPGVRAAVAESKESARLSRAHNDANVLCIGARLLEPAYAKDILHVWLNTQFEGGRHVDRILKIEKLEKQIHASNSGSQKK
jgi:ribose 5-phosphate isomerase B